MSDKFKEAELLLHIYSIYSSESMVDAFTWFFKNFHAETLEDFEKRYPLGSKGRKYFWRVGNFFDLLGTFLENEYLPNKLVIDFCPDDIKSFWERAKTIVLQMRKKWKDPSLFSGVELLNNEVGKWQGRLEKKQ